MEGFVFETTGGTIIKAVSGRQLRITRNVFRANEENSGKWIRVQGVSDMAGTDPLSRYNRIDHNLFEGKNEPGNFITIDGSAQPNPVSSKYDRIDHNHFKDTRPRIENGKEAVRVGWSQMSLTSGYTTVEANLFENCDGDPEIIAVKTSDNIIRHNTFRRSEGTLSLRHGDRSTVEGNFFFGEGKEGTGGIRMYGDDHRIYNNYFQGLSGTEWDAPIALTNGDADYVSNSDPTRHYTPQRIDIIHNTFVGNEHGIEVGFTGSNYGNPPESITLANNLVVGEENQLVKIMTEPIETTWKGNMMYPRGNAELGVDMDESSIRVEDPLLTQQDGLWRLGSGSPAIDAAADTYDYVESDMDGQPRATPDIGADEYASSERRIRPLRPEDVGPDGPEDPFAVAREHTPSSAPRRVHLDAPFPNPVRDQTTLRYVVPQAGPVRLTVYDVLGRRVRTLVDARRPAGRYEATFQTEDFSAGTYFVRLHAQGVVRTAAATVIR